MFGKKKTITIAKDDYMFLRYKSELLDQHLDYEENRSNIFNEYNKKSKDIMKKQQILFAECDHKILTWEQMNEKMEMLSNELSQVTDEWNKKGNDLINEFKIKRNKAQQSLDNVGGK